MSKKSIGLAALALGCVVAPGVLASRGNADASAAVRRPLTFQQGRADAFVCPSPAPAGASGKIVSIPGTTEFYSTVTCTPTKSSSVTSKMSDVTAKGAAPGPIAYLYRGRPPGEPTITRLRTVAGATGARAFAVAQNGEVVGEMLFGTQGRPYRWTSGGEPIALVTPSDGIAAAVGRSGLPIVGEALNRQGVLQAAWFAPVPGFFIGPVAASLIFAVTQPAVSTSREGAVYAGELGGFAAAAVSPNALKRLPSVKFPSTALAINASAFIVGNLVLPRSCGNGLRVSGFGTQFPDGRLELVPPLAGDCLSSALDVSDVVGGTRAIVGYSGLPAVQRADGLDLINYPPGLIDLNASQRYESKPAPGPWVREGHRLIAATGTDDRGDIAATDSAGKVWFLHIP